jgi:hypothetical protein
MQAAVGRRRTVARNRVDSRGVGDAAGGDIGSVHGDVVPLQTGDAGGLERSSERRRVSVPVTQQRRPQSRQARPQRPPPVQTAPRQPRPRCRPCAVPQHPSPAPGPVRHEPPGCARQQCGDHDGQHTRRHYQSRKFPNKVDVTMPTACEGKRHVAVKQHALDIDSAAAADDGDIVRTETDGNARSLVLAQ